MEEDNKNWRKIDYWGSSIDCMLVLVATPIEIAAAVGLVLGVLYQSWFLFAVPIALGVIFSIAFLLVEIIGYRMAPKRVCFNSTAIFVEYKKGKEIIPYEDIESIRSTVSERYGISVKKTGSDFIYLGPGLGGRYGLSLLNEYIKWVEANRGRKMLITEKKVFFTRWFEPQYV